MVAYLNFFVIVAIGAFTPGPNNSMLMQSGIYFGLRKTRHHIYGIIIGFSFLFFCINMGIYTAINRFPILNMVIKSVGTVYFIYLAYRMISLSPPAPEENQKPHWRKQYKPLRFWGAFLFQWVNLKAWVFALSSVGALPPEKTGYSILISQLAVLTISIGSTLTWTLGGVLIASFLKKRLYLRIVSILLALSLVYVSIAQWA